MVAEILTESLDLIATLMNLESPVLAIYQGQCVCVLVCAILFFVVINCVAWICNFLVCMRV